MSVRRMTGLILFMLLCSSSLCATELRDILGVNHGDGRYTFNPNWDYATGHAKSSTDPTWNSAWGSPNYLREGAAAAEQFGTRVLKLWYHPNFKVWYHWTDPTYPNPGDSDTANRLVTLAQDTRFYQPIFANPAFTTIILVIPPNSSDSQDQMWNGMTQAEIVQEKTAMKNFAKYLLQTYKNSGKTFVLQSWETDSMFWGQYGGQPVPPEAIQGIIDWTNARQDGVSEARQEVGSVGVQVAYALEVNAVVDARSGLTDPATNSVVPGTHCDLYSYSAWDGGKNIPATDPDYADKWAAQLADNLHYLESKAPDSSLYGYKNIYIGELGLGENQKTGNPNDPDETFGPVRQKEAMRRYIETAIGWGVRYIIYWGLYCNVPEPYSNPGTHITSNSAMAGLWLVRVDGSHTPLYDFMQQTLFSQSVVHAGLASVNNLYVSADQGGGNTTITVERTWLWTWEMFAVLSRQNRSLTSGNSVNLLTYNGHYVMAVNDGGGSVTADSHHDLSWEQFTIAKTSGSGAIANNDLVSFNTGSASPYYLTAPGGGGAGVPLQATSSSAGANETFRLAIVDPPSGVCTYSVAVPSLAFGAGGGTVTASVTASNSGCSWIAQGTDFVTATPSQATGSTTVSITAPANTGGARTATVVIAGQTFSATQSAGSPQPSAVSFYTVTPCRLLDTRNTGPYGGPALNSMTARNLVVVGQCSIASGATAVVINLAAVTPPSSGRLVAYPGPAGTAVPNASTLNFSTGETLSNNSIVPIGPDGSINIYSTATSPMHAVIDVYGFFK